MKFIALPVGQGDAFYAETDGGFRVLVDGGRSRRGLPELFRRYTRSSMVDVLVCTHNDADHAEGVIGFLESGLLCKELWLPETWLQAVRSLPDDSEQTVSLLWEQLDKASETGFLPESVEGRDLQEIAWRSFFPELIGQRPIRDNAQAQETPEGRDAFPLNAYLDESTIKALDEHLEFFAPPWPWCLWPRYWWWKWQYLPWSVVRCYVAVAQDTRRLLELVWLALNRGIAVRCFKHDPLGAVKVSRLPSYPLWPVSGRPSCYVRPPKRTGTAGEFFWMLYLTTVNRESLVLFLDPGNGERGVLFTADSDLKGVNVGNVPQWSIATAPHHGSHDNRSVYGLINKPMVWVRSDGYSKTRPCVEFLQAPGRRFCTLCRGSRKPKQVVRLYQRQGSWLRLRTRPCECR